MPEIGKVRLSQSTIGKVELGSPQQTIIASTVKQSANQVIYLGDLVDVDVSNVSNSFTIIYNSATQTYNVAAITPNLIIGLDSYFSNVTANAAGSDWEIQFNKNGQFASNIGFKYIEANSTLILFKTHLQGAIIDGGFY